MSHDAIHSSTGRCRCKSIRCLRACKTKNEQEIPRPVSLIYDPITRGTTCTCRSVSKIPGRFRLSDNLRCLLSSNRTFREALCAAPWDEKRNEKQGGHVYGHKDRGGGRGARYTVTLTCVPWAQHEVSSYERLTR